MRTGSIAVRVIAGLVLASLLSAAGCQNSKRLYEGPRRPAEEVAVITPVPYDLVVFHTFHVEIVAVDGQSLGLANRTATVLPGSHTVRLRRGSGTGKKEETEFTFDAKAGHVYEVDAKDLDGDPPRTVFWLVDTHDNTLIAGERPPADPDSKAMH